MVAVEILVRCSDGVEMRGMSWWMLAAVVAGGGWGVAETQAAEPGKPARMLMITDSQGYRHGPVTRDKERLAPAEVAMIQLGTSTGLFTVDCSQSAKEDFTKANLANYDLVMFYTTGNLGVAQDDLDYFFKEWLTKKGHGFIGAHSAADTYGDYQPYWDMVGGTFNGHPWNAGDTVTITVHDTAHPAMKPFGAEFQIKDEIYQYKNWQPEKVRVLMSLSMEKTPLKKPYHVPVAWVKQYGEGRVFFTNLGHNNETWADKRMMASMTGGIRWILGYDAGDATPNPELSKAEEEKAKKAAGDAK